MARTALSKPGGFAGGLVVVVGAAGRAGLRAVDGGAAVTLVEGAGGAVVVAAALGPATARSDATPWAADVGDVRDAALST